MKVGDLVRVKNTSWEVYGIVLEINGQFKWAEVLWNNGHTYAFFAEDLEIVNGDRTPHLMIRITPKLAGFIEMNWR